MSDIYNTMEREEKLITIQIKINKSDYRILKGIKGSMTWVDFLLASGIEDLEKYMRYRYEKRNRNR